jgi:nicotinamidase-related amidase
VKEEYYTTSNIYDKADTIINQSYMTSGRTQSDEINVENSALLVLDMQDYFLREESKAYIPSTTAILPNLVTLTETINDKNIPVIYTRHVNNCEDAGMMGVWWHRLIESGNPLSNLSRLFDTDGKTVIDKTRYDAFWGTELNNILKQMGIERLIVTGVMTNLCVETTIRSAFQHGYECTLLVDGTAAYNFDMHLATCVNLSFGFCKLNLISEILGAFNAE